MSALGLVPTRVREPEPSSPPSTPPIHLLLEDVLASPRRLWVRGRLRSPEMGLRATDAERRWWSRWRGKTAAPAPPPQVRLVTRVSGNVLETSAPLQADGRFEALVEAVLPVARRGWRVARHRATFEERSAEACNVVLAPGPETTGVLAVLIPAEFSYEPGDVQRLAKSEFAARLGKELQQLDAEAGGRLAFFYVACVPPDAENRQVELALATTSLGWPAGTFVLMPAPPKEKEAALAVGVDRLRWLFDGHWGVRVLPAAPAATERARPTDDRLGANPAPIPVPARAYRRPARAGRIPRYPVVFCHGMLACSMLKMKLPEDGNCFTPLRDFLRERGFRVLYPQVAPTSGVVERAAQLRERILQWTDEPVNIIAHSMGGLDARYMITHLGMADRVRSLTTVSTPHRGTHLAEWFVANFRNRVPLLLALEAFGVNVDGFRDCLPAACAALNATTPDRPEVQYFSYGGSVPQSKVSPMLRRAWNILTPIEGENDGMVAAASAHWGQYLGTLCADHFAQTPDGVFVRPGEDFDALGFYSRLVEDLARRGF